MAIAERTAETIREGGLARGHGVIRPHSGALGERDLHPEKLTVSSTVSLDDVDDEPTVVSSAGGAIMISSDLEPM